MNKLHEKSPCCNASIRLFGERRRQCTTCKKTWRVWKKNLGRKKHRCNFHQLFQYFEGKSGNTRIERRTFSARLRLALQKFNEEVPWPEIPSGPLIAIADGIIEYFGNKKYCIYFILLRRVSDSKAFILPPYMHVKGENADGWKKAFLRIPKNMQNRICTLVCDGHRGLICVAGTYGWSLQRCHFHLIRSIAHFASFGPRNKTKSIGIRIGNLVRVILNHKEEMALSLALKSLQKIKDTIISKRFKTVVSGFLRYHEDYRTYLDLPHFNLPSTTNSAESLNSLIRGLQYRARGFRTPKSYFSWITGFCKYKKWITCRPKNQPN